MNCPSCGSEARQVDGAWVHTYRRPNCPVAEWSTEGLTYWKRSGSLGGSPRDAGGRP